MKVRLKQVDRPFTEMSVIRFQFHEGPIKTQNTIRPHIFTIMFQFHEGPIKTKSD